MPTIQACPACGRYKSLVRFLPDTVALCRECYREVLTMYAYVTRN